MLQTLCIVIGALVVAAVVSIGLADIVISMRHSYLRNCRKQRRRAARKHANAETVRRAEFGHKMIDWTEGQK